MKIQNKTYDVLKWIALEGLPYFITFYGVLGVTLKIPYTQEALTIMTAFDAMLGGWLGLSSKKYNEIDNADLKG